MDTWKQRAIWTVAGALCLSVMGGLAVAQPDMPAPAPPADAVPPVDAAPPAQPPLPGDAAPPGGVVAPVPPAPPAEGVPPVEVAPPVPAIPPATTPAPAMVAPPANGAADAAAKALFEATIRRYAAMRTLRMRVRSTMRVDNYAPEVQVQTISFARPNKFRVVASYANNKRIIRVSDGRHLVVYSNIPGFPVRQLPAPANLGHYSLEGGSALDIFTGGPDLRREMLGANPRVSFRPDRTVGGMPCRVIAFNIINGYGNTEVAIGRRDGLVHYDSCDFLPSLRRMQAEEPHPPTRANGVAIYEQILVNRPAAAAEFSTVLPPGLHVTPPPPPSFYDGTPEWPGHG